MKPYAFGVDVGGTSVKLGLFSTAGALLEKWEIPTPAKSKSEAVLSDIAASIQAKSTEKHISFTDIEGIGICVPGTVDDTSTVHMCIDLKWDAFNLKEQMKRLLPEIPNVVASNAANAATLGELCQGSGKGYRSTVMLILGTGVSGGICINGRIISGLRGGIEAGHMTVNPTEPVRCTCGKHGCLEQYVSSSGIVRMANVMLTETDTPSVLREMETFSSKDIFDLARSGEGMALEILDRFGDYTGRALNYISCTVDPDIFIIGGDINQAGDILIQPITKYFRKYAFHASVGTPIVLAKLGDDAGIYGCASMVSCL